MASLDEPDEAEHAAAAGRRPASYVRERLAAYREAGVTVLNVEQAGPARWRRTPQPS
jgi:hypothetical protein